MQLVLHELPPNGLTRGSQQDQPIQWSIIYTQRHTEADYDAINMGSLGHFALEYSK